MSLSHSILPYSRLPKAGWKIARGISDPSSIELSLSYFQLESTVLNHILIEVLDSDNFELSIIGKSDQADHSLNLIELIAETVKHDLQIIPKINRAYMIVKFQVSIEKLAKIIDVLKIAIFFPNECARDMSDSLRSSSLWLPEFMRSKDLLQRANKLFNNSPLLEAELYDTDNSYKLAFNNLIKIAIEQDLIYFFALREEFKNQAAHQYGINLATAANKLDLLNVLSANSAALKQSKINFDFIKDYENNEAIYRQYKIEEINRDKLVEAAENCVNSLLKNPSDTPLAQELARISPQLDEQDKIVHIIFTQLPRVNEIAWGIPRSSYHDIHNTLISASKILKILTDNSLATSHKHWGDLGDGIKDLMTELRKKYSPPQMEIGFFANQEQQVMQAEASHRRPSP